MKVSGMRHQGTEEGHGIGLGGVDYHAAAFAPILTDIKHSLQVMGVTSYENDVIHKGPKGKLFQWQVRYMPR